MALVTAGLMNKQVAGELGLSEITVKIHRGHIMRKMSVRSLADLVRASEALELHQPAKIDAADVRLALFRPIQGDFRKHTQSISLLLAASRTGVALGCLLRDGESTR